MSKLGWRGYKETIDVGMIFKKMYCKKCGTKLKIKKNKIIVKKGDEDYSSRMPGKGNALGMSSYYDATYVYYCPNYGLETTYDEQCILAKKQKLLKKKILDEND